MKIDTDYWREKLGIKPGMTREESLSKFLMWKEDKKTCGRCSDKDLSNFCDLRQICQEAKGHIATLEEYPVLSPVAVRKSSGIAVNRFKTSLNEDLEESETIQIEEAESYGN